MYFYKYIIYVYTSSKYTKVFECFVQQTVVYKALEGMLNYCTYTISDSSFYIFYKIYLFIYLFIYLWLCWVFVAARGLSLVAASGGNSLLQCAGFSLQWLLLLQSTGSRHMGFSSCGTRTLVVARRLQSAGSVVVVHRPNCSAACGIFPDQGSNPRPLHWQVDS